MSKKYLSIALAATVACLLILPAPAHAQVTQDAQATEKIKADVARIGTGARVSVKLRGKERLTGYVSQINEQDFVITKAKEGTKQTVAYADATEVKVKNEKRISTAGKILIGIGALWVVGMIATGGGG